MSSRLDVVGEPRDERLRHRVAEHELRPNHENLQRRQHRELFTQLHIVAKQSPFTLGVKPLNNALAPSSFNISEMTFTPLTFVSKFAFWILVFTVSRGAATVIEATAPATEATKFWKKVALE